jgi:DNA-binding response OmpR family regulator
MPKTVLIVDDEPATLEGLATLVAGEGYRVLTAQTFKEGRRAMQTEHPDLLLVDIRIGEFNGLQLVATASPPLPSIVMTGYEDAVLERDARQFGADYLLKPIAPDVLLATIRRRLAVIA